MSINLSAWLHLSTAKLRRLLSRKFNSSPLKDGPGKEDDPLTFQGREPLKLPKGVYIPQELTCIPLYTQNDAFEMVTPFEYVC